MNDFSPVGLIFILIVGIWLLNSIKILREYERGVIFRLGRILSEPKGPGLVFVFAPVDRMVRVSLRIDTLEVPAQDVVTRDNVTVKVNAVIYFRVINPTLAVIEVSNFLYATSQLAQTTLRSVLGEVELGELLGQREKLNVRLQAILDQHTSPWGVKVTMGEVKQVDLAEQMIRVISRQAEAGRGRRAEIIPAEGEDIGSEKMGMASDAPAQPASQTPAPATESNSDSSRLLVAGADLPPGSFWQLMAIPQPEAEAIGKTLRDKGFPAVLSPGPKHLTRVLVGPFRDTQSFGRAKSDLESAGFQGPVRYRRD